MEQYANSLIRNRRKLDHEIASDHDNSEEGLELKELQRRTRYNQPSESA